MDDHTSPQWDIVADLVLGEFRDFYGQFREIPELSRLAFEQRDHARSLRLSGRRLQLYSISIRDFSDRIKREYPVLAADESSWEMVERRYLESVEGEYAADLAMAYLHSIRRKIYQGEWRVND